MNRDQHITKAPSNFKFEVIETDEDRKADALEQKISECCSTENIFNPVTFGMAMTALGDKDGK